MNLNKLQEVKKLSSPLKRKIRSGIALPNITQCIEELVLNSLDAKSTRISIVCDFDNFYIEVDDNGLGIHPNDFQDIGDLYATSKCSTLSDVDRSLKYFGYRGEALASIACVSAHLEITSLCRGETKVQFKCIGKNSCVSCKRKPVKLRGTTVVVKGLYSGLKLRCKFQESRIEKERSRKLLEQIALLHPCVCFQFRSRIMDKSNLLLSIEFHSSVNQRMKSLFNLEPASKHIKSIAISRGSIRIQSEISLQLHSDKNIQFIFVNGRYLDAKNNPVYKHVRKLIHDCLKESIDEEEMSCKEMKLLNAVFCINIIIPRDKYDATIGPYKREVLFQNIALIEHLLLKSIEKFAKKYKLPKVNTTLTDILTNKEDKKIKSSFGNITLEHAADGIIKGKHFVGKCRKRNLCDKKLPEPEQKENIWQSKDWVKKYVVKLGRDVFVNSITGATRFHIDDSHFGPNDIKPVFISKKQKRKKLKSSFETISASNSSSLSGFSENWKNPVFRAKHDEISQSIKIAIKEKTKISKNIFDEIQVIGQVDSKFILCASLINSKRMLLIFDQHAVHERIRLEKLQQEVYVETTLPGRQIKSYKLESPFSIQFDSACNRDIAKWQNEFHAIGLEFEHDFDMPGSKSLAEDTTTIIVNKIPQTFMQRVGGNDIKVVQRLTKKLIVDELKTINRNGGKISSLPRTIFDELCSQACRGAIMFGDKLEAEVCKHLITELAKCSLPFQCAHGRPSVCPL